MARTTFYDRERGMFVRYADVIAQVKSTSSKCSPATGNINNTSEKPARTQGQETKREKRRLQRKAARKDAAIEKMTLKEAFARDEQVRRQYAAQFQQEARLKKHDLAKLSPALTSMAHRIEVGEYIAKFFPNENAQETLDKISGPVEDNEQEDNEQEDNEQEDNEQEDNEQEDNEQQPSNDQEAIVDHKVDDFSDLPAAYMAEMEEESEFGMMMGSGISSSAGSRTSGPSQTSSGSKTTDTTHASAGSTTPGASEAAQPTIPTPSIHKNISIHAAPTLTEDINTDQTGEQSGSSTSPAQIIASIHLTETSIAQKIAETEKQGDQALGFSRTQVVLDIGQDFCAECHVEKVEEEEDTAGEKRAVTPSSEDESKPDLVIEEEIHTEVDQDTAITLSRDVEFTPESPVEEEFIFEQGPPSGVNEAKDDFEPQKTNEDVIIKAPTSPKSKRTFIAEHVSLEVSLEIVPLLRQPGVPDAMKEDIMFDLLCACAKFDDCSDVYVIIRGLCRNFDPELNDDDNAVELSEFLIDWLKDLPVDSLNPEVAKAAQQIDLKYFPPTPRSPPSKIDCLLPSVDEFKHPEHPGAWQPQDIADVDMKKQLAVILMQEVLGLCITNDEIDIVERRSGSFNTCCIMSYAGIKYILRVPKIGHGEKWTEPAKEQLRSEVATHKAILLNTGGDFPCPDIIDYDTETDNIINAPFLIMTFLRGQPASHLWFDRYEAVGEYQVGRFDSHSSDDKVRLRIRFLRSLAEKMAMLFKITSFRTGMITYDNDKDRNFIVVPHICAEDLYSEHVFTERKMCSSSFDFYKTRIDEMFPLAKRTTEQQNCVDFLTLMLEQEPFNASTDMPPIEFARRGEEIVETFGLHLPDLNLQNIFVDESGEVSGIFDLDGTSFVPRCAGPGVHPLFLRTDCAGEPYDYPETPPEQIDAYRAFYTDAIKAAAATGPASDARFTGLSSLYMAFHTALYPDMNRLNGNMACTAQLIMEKMRPGASVEDIRREFHSGNWTEIKNDIAGVLRPDNSPWMH